MSDTKTEQIDALTGVTTYATAEVFLPGTLEVSINGVRQAKGGVCFTENGTFNGFELVEPLETDAPADELAVQYEVDSGAVAGFPAVEVYFTDPDLC